MRITINDKQKQISRRAEEQAKARIRAKFLKLGSLVASVEVSVQDVNGPRGGPDQRCQIAVRLRKMGVVVVAVTNAGLSKAISHAISKAHRATGRKVQRRLVRNSRRRANLAFALLS